MRRQEVDGLLASAEWALPSWRLVVVFSTAWTYVRYLDSPVGLVLVLSAAVNVLHLWSTRHGHGLFLWGTRGMLVDLGHSLAATIAIALAFPNHTYLSQPATLPYLNYASPLLVVWIVRRYLITEGRRPKTWLTAAILAALLVAAAAALVVALGVINGYALRDVPIGDILASAAWLGAAFPLGYGIVRVVQRLTEAGLADLRDAQERFERWLHSDVISQLDMVAGELDAEAPDILRLRGQVKAIRAATAAKSLDLYRYSDEQTVAAITRYAIQAHSGHVQISSHPVGGWTVTGRSAELFQRVLGELISNIRRHANASEAKIDIAWHLDRLVVRIEDDGSGLGPADWASQTNSLHRLRSDLARAGGSLSCSRSELGGARLEAEIPMEVT